MAERKRIIWIDQLKGFIFFLVILGHFKMIDATAKSYIYSFHMPIFFFITGLNYNVTKIFNTKPKDYLIKLSTRMLVPYVWMETTVMCVRQVAVMIQGGEVPASRYIKGMLVGHSHFIDTTVNPLYFLLILYLAEVGLFLLVKVFKGKRNAVLAGCIALIPLSILTPKLSLPWHLNVVPAAMLFIMIGNLLMDVYRKNEEKISSISTLKNITMAIAFLIVGAIVWKFNGRFSLHGNKYGNDFALALISALATSIGVTLIFIRIPKIKFLTFVGRYTLFYMGTHASLISLLQVIFKGHISNPLFIVCGSIAIYFALIPVTMLCKKIAPFILGISNPGEGAILTAGQIASVIAATCIPYSYFLRHLKDGFLISTPILTAASIIAYFVICAIAFFLLRKVFTFAFLIDKKTSKT